MITRNMVVRDFKGGIPAPSPSPSFSSLGGPNSFVDLIINSQLHSAATFTRASKAENEAIEGTFSQVAVNEPRYRWVEGQRGAIQEKQFTPITVNTLGLSKSANAAVTMTNMGNGVNRVVSSGVPSPEWAYCTLETIGQPNTRLHLVCRAEIYLESATGADLQLGARLGPPPYTATSKNIFPELKIGQWVSIAVPLSAVTDATGRLLVCHIPLMTSAITFQIRNVGIDAADGVNMLTPSLSSAGWNTTTSSTEPVAGALAKDGTQSVVRFKPKVVGNATLAVSGANQNRSFIELSTLGAVGTFTAFLEVKTDAVAADVTLSLVDYQTDTMKVQKTLRTTGDWQVIEVTGEVATATGVRLVVCASQNVLTGKVYLAKGAPSYDWINGRRALVIEQSKINYSENPINFLFWPSSAVPVKVAGAGPSGFDAYSWDGAGRLWHEPYTIPLGKTTVSIYGKILSGAPVLTLQLKDYQTDTVRASTQVALTNGWSRVSATGITLASSAPSGLGCRLEVSISGGVSLLSSAGAETGDLSSAIQANYINTRAPDLLSFDTAAFGFNPNEGTFVCTCSISEYADSLFEIDAGPSRRIGIALGYPSRTQVSAFVTSGGGYYFATLSAPAVGVTSKFALTYSLNEIALAIDGVVAVTSAVFDLPTWANRLCIGRSEVTASKGMNGQIISLPYYSRKFSKAELESLTK